MYANLASFVRMVGGPAFAALLYLYLHSESILVLFLILVFTDWLDGVLARKYGETRFGAWLDPFADKILIWSFLFVFYSELSSSVVGGAPILILGFGLDIVSEIIRYINYGKESKNIKANWWGKFKTGFYYTAIGLMISSDPESFWTAFIHGAAFLCLIVAVSLSFVSLIKKLRLT